MLEVFGAGVGRTGTMSLRNALHMLGFAPCHHMLHLLETPEEVPLWESAAAGEPVDWSEVYAGYRASVDWPGARWWREITAAFPEAKVILTIRDPESWYESAMNSIYPAATTPAPPEAPASFERVRQLSVNAVWDGIFGGRFADREYAIRLFNEHNEAVKREIPSDRLLVFQASQGWEPLCEFLGVPVPDEPYPHANDRKQFSSAMKEQSTAAQG